MKRYRFEEFVRGQECTDRQLGASLLSNPEKGRKDAQREVSALCRCIRCLQRQAEMMKIFACLIQEPLAALAAAASSFNSCATEENAAETAGPSLSGAKAKTRTTNIEMKAKRAPYSEMPWPSSF